MKLKDLAAATAKALAEHPERAEWPVVSGCLLGDTPESPSTFSEYGDSAYMITYPPRLMSIEFHTI